jgi:hypothetical protein
MISIMKEEHYAGLLRKMPHQERDEKRQRYHYEERTTGYTGRMPGVQHQDV